MEIDNIEEGSEEENEENLSDEQVNK